MVAAKHDANHEDHQEIQSSKAIEECDLEVSNKERNQDQDKPDNYARDLE